MNIFYEEGGQFKAAAVIQKNDNTYQAETQSGKRAKIKAANVFIEFDGKMDEFLERARSEAADIDTQLLWEVCGSDEFSAYDIAADYFGGEPTKVQHAATLMALYAAPAYFYKKGKGVFKAAPEEILKQALLAIERKKQQDAQMQAWIDELVSGSLPEEIAAELVQILHAPDKQSPAYKAFQKAADALKTNAYELAKRVGGIASFPQYLLDGFTVKHFPKGTDFPETAVPELPELPLAQGVAAFSIDDESTTEVDDALSVQDLDGGSKRIGIHIAAPALAVDAGSAIDRIIADRQSTVYYPGGKITMLPENWIQTFSLDAGSERPALSIYFDVDCAWQLSNVHSKIERVYIADNLRIQNIEAHFSRDTAESDAPEHDFPHRAHMQWLYRFAVERQKQRGRYEENRPVQYDYGIELLPDGTVAVSTRERGSPIDTLVSEMMILANSRWAQQLDEAQVGGMFRVQPSLGKVRMSTKSEPHIGMGVQHYGWFTSPLRRAADCLNQQQLIAILRNGEVRFGSNDAELFAALRDFDAAYTAYADFQREMEAYWSLVYLQQQKVGEIAAVVLKEDLVRLNGVPLTARATGIPFEVQPRSTVKLAVGEIDPEKQFVALSYRTVLPSQTV